LAGLGHARKDDERSDEALDRGQAKLQSHKLLLICPSFLKQFNFLDAPAFDLENFEEQRVLLLLLLQGGGTFLLQLCLFTLVPELDCEASCFSASVAQEAHQLWSRGCPTEWIQ